ncbi:MAG: DUF2975 domain-containing protein [Dokdonella sp.]
MTASPNPLALARTVIRGLIVLNTLYAIAIGVLLIACLVNPTLLFRALGGLEGAGAWQLHAGMRAVMAVGIVGAYVTYCVLRALLAIIGTVRNGDPFVIDNARRLQAIAWWVLVGEGLRLLVGTIVWSVSQYAQPLKIHIPFSFAPWLAALLLFVLARVFEQGARMRADLEGTV